MARFSLNGGDEIDAQEDESGPSNRRQPRKKPKLTPATPASASASASASAPAQPPPQPPPPLPVVLPPEDEEYEEEEDSEDSESYEEDDDSDEEAAEEVFSEQRHQQQQVGANEEAASVDEFASYDRKLTLTLTDPDVLDCPICFENLKIPVFQCENGHIACASCCVKIRNKCPSCSFPTGYNRCRAIEKVLEASQVACKNTIYGCTTIMKYYNIHEHERRCYHSPCSCPMFYCDFIDSTWRLYSHFSKHTATNFHFACSFSASLAKHESYLFLREETLGTVFVLNQFTARQGRAVTIVQIAPKTHSGKYRYELKTKDGETSLTLKSPVECVPKLADYRPIKHYLVVEDFLCPLERVTLDVCINPPGY